MTKRVLGTGAVLLGLLYSQTAGAQEFLKDRRYAEGIGIRAGDFELHPGIAGEVGYDSNYLLRSQKSGPNIINGPPLESSGMLRITPSFSFSSIGPQRLEAEKPAEPPMLKFRGSVAATYREFIGNKTLTQYRDVSGSADARLDIAQGRPWGAMLGASYVRTIQPSVIADPNLSFNRDDLNVGGEVIAQPHGGTLDWHAGYQFHATLFEGSQGTPLNNITHEANTRGRWSFRPKSALLYDATLRFTSYTNLTNSAGGLHSSTPMRTRIGLSSLLNNRVQVLGMVGYGASFFNTSASTVVQQYDGIIGQAEVKFFLTENPNGSEQPSAVSLTLSSFALGYFRDFQISYLGDFYGSDRGYARLSYFFAGRALLSFEGSVEALEYPTIFAVDGTKRTNSFTDLRAIGSLFGEYRFTDTLAVNATFRYSQNFSSTQIPLGAAPGQLANAVFDMNWQRFEAFLGARWFM